MCEHSQSTKMNSKTAPGGLGCQNNFPLAKNFDFFFSGHGLEKQINHLTFLCVSCLRGSQDREGVPAGRGGTALTCDFPVVIGVSAGEQQQGIISPFLSSPGSIGISDGHDGSSVSPSTSVALHPGLRVPDPLQFRVNGQVIIFLQSQEVKKVMGGLSIPEKLCWWSQWTEKCLWEFLGISDPLVGWRTVLQVRQERSLPAVPCARSREDLSVLHLSLPKPSLTLPELQCSGCSPACDTLGKGRGQPLCRPERVPALLPPWA